MGGTLLYLARRDVVAACAEIDPLTCVHEALVMHARGEARLPGEAYLAWEPAGGGRARTLNMPGLLAGDLRVVGTKIINANPANPAGGLPRAAGLTILFDYQTAHPVCVMDAAYPSALRTAAVSTLAVRALRAPGARHLAVVGAGVIAAAHVEMMLRRVDGIGLVLAYDTDPAAVDGLRARLRPVLSTTGTALEATGTAAEAARRADILVTTTTTTTPYLDRADLRPGVVAVNVSLDDLTEEALLGADRLYVDDWHLIVDDRNRLLGRLARAGRVTGPGEPPAPGARAVTGTLGGLLDGRCPGRGSPEDVIVVNPFGMSVCDLAVARQVHAVARMRGLGVALPY